MNRFMLLLMLCCIGKTLTAQYVYTIKADSVKITNSCDTAELIIENHTQTVPGFLYNKGRGRTEFRRGLVTVNDSIYLIGDDTLKMRNKVFASNGLSVVNDTVQLGGELTKPTFISIDQWPYFQFYPEQHPSGGGHDGTQTSLALQGRYNMSGGAAPGGTSYMNEIWIGAEYHPTAGNIGYRAIEIEPDIDQTGGAAGHVKGVSVLPYAANLNGKLTGFYFDDFTDVFTGNGRRIAFENRNRDNYFNTSGGNTGIGINSNTAGANGNITARLHIAAGTSTAGTSPIKLNLGSAVLTAPERGAFEFASGRLTFTPVTTRKRFVLANDVTPGNGQIPIGDGTDYTANTLTAGSGIAITNGSGSITIAARATVSVSAASSLALNTSSTDYIFSGTTATWTLPAISGNTGVQFFIKNRGTGILTVNSNVGGNDLYTTSAVSSLTVNPGEAFFLLNDGTYYSVK